MTDRVEDTALFERYKNIRLVNIGKVCPQCQRTHYIESLLTEVTCACGGGVSFTLPEKRHVIESELRPDDPRILKRL